MKKSPIHVEEQMAAALRRTASVPIACHQAGITPRTLAALLADDPDLRDRLEAARCDGEARIVEEVYRRAFEALEEEPVLSGGTLVFGWWDREAGTWIDPDTWPGGEEALRRAAEAGRGIESKAVTRPSPGAAEERDAYLLAYARICMPAWRRHGPGGGDARDPLRHALDECLPTDEGRAAAHGRAPNDDPPIH